MVSVSSVRQTVHLSTHRLNGTSAMAHYDHAHYIAVYDGHAYTAMHCARIKKSVDGNMVHHIIKMLSDQIVMCRMGSMCMATRLSWLYGLSAINAPDRYIGLTVATRWAIRGFAILRKWPTQSGVSVPTRNMWAIKSPPSISLQLGLSRECHIIYACHFPW